MDWQMPIRSQACRNRPAVYSAALISVQDHAGHRAAAHRHRHRQRPVSQLGAVMLPEGEPDDPARAHVQHRIHSVESELSGFIRFSHA
jgi:hypothetical protein